MGWWGFLFFSRFVSLTAFYISTIEGFKMRQVMMVIDIPIQKGKALREELNRFEYDVICSALSFTNGNISEAGRAIGVKRTTLSMRMTALDIDATDYRD